MQLLKTTTTVYADPCHLTSKLNSKTVPVLPSLKHYLNYTLFSSLLPLRCTLPDFPSVTSLVSLLQGNLVFLYCCHRTTTYVPLQIEMPRTFVSQQYTYTGTSKIKVAISIVNNSYSFNYTNCKLQSVERAKFNLFFAPLASQMVLKT